MEVDRKGNKLTIQLDTAEEAIGLFAVLSGTTKNVKPEIVEKGQWLYQWFYKSVEKLYSNYKDESSVRSMSFESLSRNPSTNIPSKRAKKR